MWRALLVGAAIVYFLLSTRLHRLTDGRFNPFVEQAISYIFQKIFSTSVFLTQLLPLPFPIHPLFLFNKSACITVLVIIHLLIFLTIIRFMEIVPTLGASEYIGQPCEDFRLTIRADYGFYVCVMDAVIRHFYLPIVW
jgi:hypothetical protein